jgi:DNA-binding MarR family transcriptional regulator
MKTNTAKEIVAYLERHPGAKPNDLVNYLGISRQAVFRHLKKMLENNLIVKKGGAPNVFYSVKLR